MRAVMLLGLGLLAGCSADSQVRVNMQAQGGSFRAEPLVDQPGRWRVIATNAVDIGYDGAKREDRLQLARTALRCPALKVLAEREMPGGTGAPIWRQPVTYVIDVEC